MVHTRGPKHTDNFNNDQSVQKIKHQLQRSEEKIQIIIAWIRENFGETNSLFNDLWKILRDFDEESSETFGEIYGIGNQRKPTETEAVEVKVPSEGSSRISSTVKSASELYNLGKRSVQPTLIEKKLGKTAYVLVEHLDLGIATLSKLPQRCAPKGATTSKIQEDRARPRRERKQSLKLRSAESNGDEIRNPFAIAYDNIKVEEEESIMDANESDDQDNSSYETADPLRLSNSNSSDSDSDYEPSPNPDIGQMSEDINSNTGFKKVKSSAIRNRSLSQDHSGHDSVQLTAPFLFACTHCDSRFTTSIDFVKHQLLHDIEEESQSTSMAAFSQSSSLEVKLLKQEENAMMNYQTTVKEDKKLGTPLKRKRHRHFKIIRDTTQEKEKSDNNDVIGNKRPIKRRRRFKIVQELGGAEPNATVTRENRKSGRPKGSCKPKGPSICEICGKMLKNLCYLRNHISAIHEPRVQSFPCPKCDKVLKNEGSLRGHLKLHDPGAKCHLCSICGQAFTRAPTMENHMKTHFDVRSFKCSYCDKTFKQRQGLVIHENRHLGKQDNKECTICGLRVANNNALRRHINAVHENIRPNKCNLCNKAFKTGSSLKYHLKTHDNPNSKKRGLNRPTDSSKGSKRYLNGFVNPQRIPRIYEQGLLENSNNGTPIDHDDKIMKPSSSNQGSEKTSNDSDSSRFKVAAENQNPVRVGDDVEEKSESGDEGDPNWLMTL